MSDPILTERDGAILIVTVNRPPANAIDLATSRVMGEIFRQADFRLGEAAICDGLVANWLATTFPAECRYEPELYVLFNRLEPGRWAVDYDLTR